MLEREHTAICAKGASESKEKSKGESEEESKLDGWEKEKPRARRRSGKLRFQIAPVAPFLESKRSYLFRGMNPTIIPQIQLDSVAGYSVTPRDCADHMTNLICTAMQARRREINKPLDPLSMTIVDAMACVGGNTLSFSQVFGRVEARELDEKRSEMLRHNVEVFGASNVNAQQGDALELNLEELDADAVFLDAEWGGPNYRTHREVLKISTVPLNIVASRFLNSVDIIALKLPLGDSSAATLGALRALANAQNLQFTYHATGFRHIMTLAILSKTNKK